MERVLPGVPEQEESEAREGWEAEGWVEREELQDREESVSAPNAERRFPIQWVNPVIR
jgi:hypothetical protein